MDTKYYGEDAHIDKCVANMISNEIYCNDSYLMEELFKKEVLEYDLLENSTFTEDEDASEYDEDCAGEHKDIFEWWRISDGLLKELRTQEEPVIESDYGNWWGRTCTGQSITLDPTFYDIYDN